MNTISFEVYPPKQDNTSLLHHCQHLHALQPKFFSVTFGAAGSNQSKTEQTVRALINKGYTVTPHISCAGITKLNVLRLLDIYLELNIQHLIVVRGDQPQHATKSPDELNNPLELITLIRSYTGQRFHISVAAYPEVHPKADSAMSDIFHLKQKLHAGANSAITQYFFEPHHYFDFIEQCAKNKIFAPITPGIMPIQNFAKIVEFSSYCGITIPEWLTKRFHELASNPISLQNYAIDIATQLCDNLLAGGAPGLHFYTLNHSYITSAVCKNLALTTPVKYEEEEVLAHV